ncbi:MAG TPA: hypothetical protein VIX17_05190 [Pyrinomonadaceae bacterium]
MISTSIEQARKFLHKLPLLSTLMLLAVPIVAQTNSATAEGWVVLPVDEYRALRRAAFPTDADPAQFPVEATLTRIDYELKVDEEIATGEARLTVDVIKDGWVSIAIPEGLMVREAKLDGKPVTLVARPKEKGPGGADLLLSNPGRSVLTLKIVASVSTVAGTEILKLPTSNSAVSHAVVELARHDIDVRITGGLLLEHSDAGTGSRWIASGQGADSLTFAWQRRIDDQRSNQPLRLRGNVAQLVALGEDSTQVTAEIQVDVLQGTAPDIRVHIPDQFTVNQVAGAMVTDWDSSGGDLIVTFIEPISQSTRFTINGELPLAREGKVNIPLLRLATVERETGGIGVEVLGAGEIKDKQATGLDEAEAGDLGQLIAGRQSPSLIAFRLEPGDGKSNRSLSLSVARYTPQAVLTANIQEADYSALVTADGKILVQSRFAVRNNQRNFLRVILPVTARLWSASVGGKPIKPGRDADGSLLLPLEKMSSGEDAPAFAVEISYLDQTNQWNERGRIRLSLLSVDLPISKSRLLLHHPPQFRVTQPQGIISNFRTAAYEEPQSQALRASSSEAIETTGPQPTALLTQRFATQAKPPARNRPLRVPFPHFGPSVFFIAELTGENQTPSIELDFQRDKKRGVK